MRMESSYNYYVMGISILIAIFVSYSAFILLLRLRRHSISGSVKWVSAIAMGIAVCGMHYIGLRVAQVEDLSGNLMGHKQSPEFFFLCGVTITILMLLSVSWVIMFFDRHELEKMAYRDDITGLLNRNAMNRFFDKRAGRENVGVLFLDLDQFKKINDTLGHHIGDLIVKEVGTRLQQFINSKQQAFRIGGDEFLFIVKKCDIERAEQLANHILQSIKKPYTVGGEQLNVTCSIGISVGKLKHTERSSLLKAADKAMYRAKGLGKNQYCVYKNKWAA
jgi:diguanylate cyclase (GGDEF)-like protein